MRTHSMIIASLLLAVLVGCGHDGDSGGDDGSAIKLKDTRSSGEVVTGTLTFVTQAGSSSFAVSTFPDTTEKLDVDVERGSVQVTLEIDGESKTRTLDRGETITFTYDGDSVSKPQPPPVADG